MAWVWQDPRAAWRRWYKANRKWQRELRTIKKGGAKINPNYTGLRRSEVK